MNIMPLERGQGRGAWNSKGVGGTLTRDRSSGEVRPGAWYMAASGDDMIQIKAVRRMRQGLPVDMNDAAVVYGAKAIQKLLGFDSRGQDGLIGPRTDERIRAKQRELGVTPDGLIGPATMKAMLLPIVKDVAKRRVLRWQLLCGKLVNEGNWDPGAVGQLDPSDLGVSQINLRAHPNVSIEDAFDVEFAIDYGARLLSDNLRVFNGNERDAIAAYNLGQGGARSWIAAGRPDLWTPSGSTSSRNVKQYIDRILGAC